MVGAITMPIPAMSSAPIGTSRTRAHAPTASRRRTTAVKTVARSRSVNAVASGTGSRGAPVDIAVTLSSVPRQVQTSANSRTDELADDADGLLGLVQHRQEPVPDVDHRRPLLDRRVDTRGAGSGTETARVVEQHLLAPDLNEQRRQVAKIGIEGRGERRLAIAVPAHIGLGERGDEVGNDDRIAGGLCRVTLAAARQIDPRRDADTGGRSRNPAIT